MDVGDLLEQIAWRCDAVFVVGLEKMVAKGLLSCLESDCDMGRTRVLEQLQQHPDKAVDRIDRQTPGIVEFGQCVESAEHVTGAVNQNQITPHLRHNLNLPDAASQGKRGSR